MHQARSSQPTLCNATAITYPTSTTSPRTQHSGAAAAVILRLIRLLYIHTPHPAHMTDCAPPSYAPSPLEPANPLQRNCHHVPHQHYQSTYTTQWCSSGCHSSPNTSLIHTYTPPSTHD